MNSLDKLHQSLVYGRRADILATCLARLLPRDVSVLDVGTGDGLLASLVMRKRPDVRIEGLEVLIRGEAHIPIREFDGLTLPYDDHSVDAVMFVDMLHHTPNACELLREAKRVARRSVVIKDHTLNGFMAGPTLRFMDRVGNARHGVNLPYLYWPLAKWRRTFSEIGLPVECWESDLRLYPFFMNWLFGRSLHFAARLSAAGKASSAGCCVN